MTILGTIFCADKKIETKENLKKPKELLKRITENTQLYLSIKGKILKLHTYIYSTIYTNAWIIDTNSTDFQSFTKEIATYLSWLLTAEVFSK